MRGLGIDNFLEHFILLTHTLSELFCPFPNAPEIQLDPELLKQTTPCSELVCHLLKVVERQVNDVVLVVD